MKIQHTPLIKINEQFNKSFYFPYSLVLRSIIWSLCKKYKADQTNRKENKLIQTEGNINEQLQKIGVVVRNLIN